MKIEILHKLSSEDVTSHIRQTPLSYIPSVGELEKSMSLQKAGSRSAYENSIFPYKESEIDIISVDPNNIRPTSFYELREGKERQRNIRDTLLQTEGIDILLLGTHHFSKDEENIAGLIVGSHSKIYTIIPTISEYPIDERYGDTSRLLGNDIVHRGKLAIELEQELATIAIRGPSHPFYALANPLGWEQNEVVNEVPKIKKAYSCKEPYKVYRNFDHGFTLPEKYPILKDNGVIISQPR